MKVFITGIRGFLGAALARDLAAHGFTVVGSSHRGDASGKIFVCDETRAPQDAWFSACDAVIHCAYDAAPGALERNLRQTQALFEAAAAAGVPRQLFISSHSARADAPGEYGRQKYLLERFFLERGQDVLRPGLILGPGGLFAAMCRQVLAMPLLVLPAPDRVPVFYVALADLLEAVRRMLAQGQRGAFNLFAPELPPLRDFVQAIAATHGKRKLIVALPLPVLDAVLRVAAATGAGARPGFARLFTARQNVREPEYHRSDLQRFVAEPLPLDAALAAAAAE